MFIKVHDQQRQGSSKKSWISTTGRHDKEERALLIEREAGNEETGAKGSLAEGSLP
jgi:hypothetical protein